MNLPNKLTVLRLILTFVFLGAMTLDFPFSKTAALLIFAIAAITDFFDGYLARKHNLITNFGKLMDPLADKILMTGGFVMLAATTDWIPAWIVVVILAREFMVTGLRLVASAEGVVLAAENLGKYKTTIQIVTVLYFLILLAAREITEFQLPGSELFGSLLVWASLILTLLSGFNYMWKNRNLLSDC